MALQVNRGFQSTQRALLALAVVLLFSSVGARAQSGAGGLIQINMAGETTADAEVKLGGVDASSPTGTSVVMNIIAPRGGNMVKGTVQYEGAKFAWNSDNA